MEAGVSINPLTNVEDVFALLKSGLISVVDLQAVEPGFGGQKFNDSAIKKVRKLVKFRGTLQTEQYGNVAFEIMVDVGVNAETASKIQADKYSLEPSSSTIRFPEKRCSRTCAGKPRKED